MHFPSELRHSPHEPFRVTLFKSLDREAIYRGLAHFETKTSQGVMEVKQASPHRQFENRKYIITLSRRISRCCTQGRNGTHITKPTHFPCGWLSLSPSTYGGGPGGSVRFHARKATIMYPGPGFAKSPPLSVRLTSENDSLRR